MPELPEVETVVRKLADRLTGHVMTQVRFRRADLRKPIPQQAMQSLVGSRVVLVHRRSKYVLIDLSSQQTIIIHLGMSGRLFFTDADAPFDRHDHVLMDFGKLHLRFRDPRRFGLIDVCATDEISQHVLFRHLGLEPLSRAFTPAALLSLLKSSKMPIKSLLMDAKKIVGVGNIYASEALFLAGLRPTRLANRMTHQDAEHLCAAVKSVLRKSIAAGGTTFRDYVGADQKPGLHSLSLKVYGRSGEPCRVCHNPIQRLIQGTRSSYFCRQCQR